MAAPPTTCVAHEHPSRNSTANSREGARAQVSRTVRGQEQMQELKFQSQGRRTGVSAPHQLFGEEVVERLYRLEFVVADVEDCIQLGDVEHVLDFLRKVEEFKLAARVAHSRVAAYEFPNARAVNVIHPDKIQDDFLLALVDQAVDGIAQLA